ncbi:MAG: hypothetical protein AB4372_12955 [Xenococcus sp. (in: cyanobacteria)]
MTQEIPPIYFYIPKKSFPKDLPENPESYWQWQISQDIGSRGDYGWTVQTYLYLKSSGLRCELIASLPDEGIVLSHRPLLSDKLQPTAKLLIICLQGDRKRHPYAQLHVVQNRLQQVPKGLLKLWESYFIPFWPQPSLIPRDPARGTRFENVAFFGERHNLIYELRDLSWQETLEDLGLRWQIRNKGELWNDYSDVDVVLALRKFGYSWDHTWKPANKLYNAWLGGVPAILGQESSYQAERKSELDYLEVASYQQLISAIKRLKGDQELRRAMAENARVRAEEIQPLKLVKRWEDFLKNIAVPAYESWCHTSEVERQRFFQARSLAYKFYSTQRQLRLIKTKIECRIKGRSFVGQQYQYL